MPLVDPQLVRQTFEQRPAGLRVLLRRHVLDVDRVDFDGTDRALVLGVRERERQDDMNDCATTGRTCTPSTPTATAPIIAAYANQRPSDGTGGAEGHPVGRGSAERRPALADRGIDRSVQDPRLLR